MPHVVLETRPLHLLAQSAAQPDRRTDLRRLAGPRHLEAIDIVFVMEKAHLRRLKARFATHLKGIRIVCLDIPDNYAFMQPELITLLEARVSPHVK